METRDLQRRREQLLADLRQAQQTAELALQLRFRLEGALALIDELLKPDGAAEEAPAASADEQKDT
jgi:hypothetical protein